jgi:hypothetical protein
MLGFRSVALWLLGYPKAAHADTDQALSRAREITPVGTLMHTLSWTIFVRVLCGHYATASALVEELVALANEKDTSFWRAWGMMNKGWLVGLTGKASDAVQVISSGIAAWRATMQRCVCRFTHHLWRWHAAWPIEDAQRTMREATTSTERTKERWFEAEVHRIAGEIALKLEARARLKRQCISNMPVARDKAKSWELRSDEHGTAVARSGQAGRGPRSTGGRLRLVFRRVRNP